jgi:putative inorganic carbon (hco3(-)) transporter
VQGSHLISTPLDRRALALAGAALIVGAAIALLTFGQVATFVVAAAAVAVVALVFAEPVIGLAFTLFAAPFGPLENIMLGLPIESGQALLLLTLAAWLARMALRRRMGLRTGPLLWPLSLFIATGVLSFFAASSFELWAKECLKWVEVLAVYALVASEVRASSRAVKIVIGAILVSTLFEAALGIYQFGLRGTGPREFAILGDRFYRAYGTFEQPNPFGGYMGLTWPLAAGVALWAWRSLLSGGEEEKRRREAFSSLLLFTAIVATLAMALSALALVLSWSRGAWLGAGAAVVIVFIVALRRPLASLSILAGVAVLVLAFNLTDLLPASLRDRLTDFTQEFTTLDVRGVSVSADNYSVIERLAHWQAAENMIVDRPYAGVGFGNYGAAYEQYRALNWPIALGHAHNYYLNIFAETGVFGLLAYLAMWGAIIARTLWAFGGRRKTDDRPPTTDHRPPTMYDAQAPIVNPKSKIQNPKSILPFLALGFLTAWVHLGVHELVDNLYVANIFLLLGAYLGLLDGLSQQPSAANQTTNVTFDV